MPQFNRVIMTEEQFKKQYNDLIVNEMAGAMQPVVVEHIAKSLGQCIAFMCRGDDHHMKFFLELSRERAEAAAAAAAEFAKTYNQSGALH